MDFSSGNSGNILREAIIKIGPGCQQEGAFCQLLGKDVCPDIYAIIPDGYVMEKLNEVSPYEMEDRNFLNKVVDLLKNKVWNRPAISTTLDTDWRDNLRIYGVKTPDWVVPKDYCLVHGDPTVSNLLSRNGHLVIADPRPPRDYIPQCRETDLGRILQSWHGWEVVAYGYKGHHWNKPYFKNDLEEDRAKFWCGAAAARIQHLELSRMRRENILDWCSTVRRILDV